MKTLKNCKVGTIVQVVRLDPNAPIKIRRRLCDLGFTPRQKVKFVRKSVLGKALLVELRGYTLSVRASVGEVVIVE